MGWARKAARTAVSVLAVAVGAVLVLGPGLIDRAANRVMDHAPWPVSDRARALQDRLVIGDWHSDALLWNRDLRENSGRGHTDLPRLAAGNVAVQVFTTVTRSPAGQNYDRNASDAADMITALMIGQLRPVETWGSLRARALNQAAALAATAQAAPDQLRLIRSRADLAALLSDRAGGSRVVGGLLGAEGGHVLEGDLANLDRLYAAGFRLIGLTHFFDNDLGGSQHGTSGAGLTEFGRAVVAQMRDRGMVIDLAHASPALVRDVLAVPGTRPILSHTGIRSHCDSPRNLPDETLRAIAARGGLIGIGFWEDVTCDASPRGVAAAIVAAVGVVGADHVSLGSDWDGAVEVGIDAGELPALTQALLDAGLDEPTIAKVMGGNMMRYLAEMLPAG